MIDHGALNDAKAILFDLDDTLYDAASFEEQADQAVAAVFARLGEIEVVEALAHAANARVEGWSGYLDRWAEAINLGRESIAEALDVRRSMSPRLELRSGAAELLSELKETGRAIAIVTNGDRRQQENKVDALGLVARWGVHVEYAADSESKPSPRAVDLALEALGIANYQALFIGDSPSDEAAARAAHVRFVWAEELFGPLRSDPLSP